MLARDCPVECVLVGAPPVDDADAEAEPRSVFVFWGVSSLFFGDVCGGEATF